MYSKDELLSKNISELEDIVKELGADISADASQEDIVYAILDKQAIVEGNKNPLTSKRRRTRIVKKDTDRVYTVNGKEGENFDLKKSKQSADQPSLFKDVPMPTGAQAVEETPAEDDVAEKKPQETPAKNGRKKKSVELPEPEMIAEEPEVAEDMNPEFGEIDNTSSDEEVRADIEEASSQPEFIPEE